MCYNRIDPCWLLLCREEIIAAGDVADRLILIASGEVEIYQCSWHLDKAAPPPTADAYASSLFGSPLLRSSSKNARDVHMTALARSSSGRHSSGSNVLPSTDSGSRARLSAAAAAAAMAMDEDDDDACEPFEAAGVQLEDASTASPAVLQSLTSVDSALQARNCRRMISMEACKVVAVKGAGDSLGFPSLRQRHRHVWQACARARGKVSNYCP